MIRLVGRYIYVQSSYNKNAILIFCQQKFIALPHACLPISKSQYWRHHHFSRGSWFFNKMFDVRECILLFCRKFVTVFYAVRLPFKSYYCVNVFRQILPRLKFVDTEKENQIRSRWLTHHTSHFRDSFTISRARFIWIFLNSF